MINAYVNYWKNYFNFKDRTSRRDFWLVILMNVIISLIFSIIANATGNVKTVNGITEMTGTIGIISYLYDFLTIIPGLAIEIRRLHDVNKSGWYLLWDLVPLVGWIMVLVQFCKGSLNSYETKEQV